MNEQSSVTSVATTLEMFTHWKIIKFRMSFAIVDITTCTCSAALTLPREGSHSIYMLLLCSCSKKSVVENWCGNALILMFLPPGQQKRKKRNPVGVEMLGKLNVPQLKKAKLYSQKVHSYPHHNYAVWDQASWEQMSCLQFDINLLW